MKKLIMTLVILLATTINCWSANSVSIQQDNQTATGSIYIKQDGAGNKFGYSTSSPFKINGANITPNSPLERPPSIILSIPTNPVGIGLLKSSLQIIKILCFLV